MRKKSLFMVVVLLLFLGAPTYAQNVSDFKQQLEGLLQTNAENYVKPLVTSTGIGLNSGIYRTAKVHKLLGFDISINATGILLPDSAKFYTFDTSQLGSYTLSQGFGGTSVTLDMAQLYPSVEDAPTFFGPQTSPTVAPNTTYARNTIISQIGPVSPAL
ncbi:MAG: hypothetical protein P8Y60_14745 [Calditrichota bacterium]